MLRSIVTCAACIVCGVIAVCIVGGLTILAYASFGRAGIEAPSNIFLTVALVYAAGHAITAWVIVEMYSYE